MKSVQVYTPDLGHYKEKEQEGRMEGWYVQKVPVDHAEWCLDMSSRHEVDFCKVFQEDLQE